MNKNKAILALADGTVFEGWSIGAEGECAGEVVFNTSITGYQEIITDPSYRCQIVTMTYPLIGNYGVNLEDVESQHPYFEGLIVKECSRYPSNWRSHTDLSSYLINNNIVGIEGIDTRALTRHIRDFGEQQAIISTLVTDHKILTERARAQSSLVGRDLVKEVSTCEHYTWQEGLWGFNEKDTDTSSSSKNGRYKVVVYDCGVKYNILRNLVQYGCDVTVVPAVTSAEDVLALNPDGILFSNGPGDPEPVSYMIQNAKDLIGKKPIMGICLGHQILSLALGCKTYKLKFGHHGGNQPVMDLKTKKVAITAQNHGFAVHADSVTNRSSSEFGRLEITHLNLNDNSLEGVECLDVPLFSVQYHPEASPGPHDANYIFEKFVNMMQG